MACVATWRFAWEGGVWAGLSCVGRGFLRRDYAEGRFIGALNWATGETVAVKEIQLSNIPKGELGEIMVSDVDFGWTIDTIFPLVRDRLAQELERTSRDAEYRLPSLTISLAREHRQI